MKQIVLDSTVIFYPQRAVEYIIKISGLSPVSIICYGSHFDNTIKFDASTGISIQKNFAQDQEGSCYKPGSLKVKFVPRESLPHELQQSLQSPIVFEVDRASGRLRSASKIIFDVQNETLDLRFEWYNDLTPNPATLYRSPISNFPHATDNTYPVFKYSNYPTKPWLKAFMSKFHEHNDECMLAQQHSKTDGWCQIRAHFICLLLGERGIPSFKIIAHYAEKDWNKFKQWKFHVATLVFDSKLKPWVIDPWIFGPWLISVDRWLGSADLPKPIDVKVMNTAIAFDRKGVNPDGANFYWMRSKHNVGMMQFLVSSFIPSKIEGLMLTLEDKLFKIKMAASSREAATIYKANTMQLQ